LNIIIHDGVRGSPDVAALASLEPKRLSVMVWHYHDDDLPGPAAQMELALDHLPLANGIARLTHYRIDQDHSNAFSEWKRMGAPAEPNEKQYAQLQKAGQLAELNAPEIIQVENDKAVLKLTLPRQAVSLLVLTWE